MLVDRNVIMYRAKSTLRRQCYVVVLLFIVFSASQRIQPVSQGYLETISMLTLSVYTEGWLLLTKIDYDLNKKAFGNKSSDENEF